ncbi:MAG TPA: N-acetylmuramoyl-L-alanine amidase [Cerasibacillus sp.]|uniref:N-acetylmuramoyl-L-alanine amidase n=1 Tax=Cerasibacillus sp. TaxID=2498711 RepID=UPI002F3FB31D
MGNLRFFIFMTVIFILIFVFIPTAKVQAESGDVYQVKSTQLNMRTQPSEEAEIVGQLGFGSELMIFEKIDGWVKTFFNGQPVWVSGKFIERIETNTQHEATETNHHSESEDEGFETEVENHDPIVNEFIPEQEDTGVQIVKPRPVQLSKDTLTTETSLDKLHIVIDAGHGGKDVGATHDSILEKDLTLKSALQVAHHLENAGAHVTLTRTNDHFLTLEDRVNLGRQRKADAFISLHFDAYTDSRVKGLSTYYSDRKSEKLAHTIQRHLIKQTGMNNRGVKHDHFYVLRENNQKAILIELGFLTNPDDFRLIQTNDYKRKVAEAIVQGLNQYFYTS